MAMQIPSAVLALKPPGGGGSITHRGRSRAGDGTTFVLQELRWMFDMGALIQQATPEVVFLTHTHNDHITFLPQILMDANKHVAVYLPTKALPFIERYLEAHRALMACAEETTTDAPDKLPYTLHPLDFHQVFTLHHKGTTYTITALECEHRIDCLGFSIMRTVKTLKPEYAGLPGRELGNLRKQGVVIHDQGEMPFLCHLGDTTHVVFERHPEILQQHRYIVVECSFFCEKTIPQAQKTKHMHWKDLRPIVESHPKVLFILIHFSLRYKPFEIRNFFAKATRTHNVHPVLVESEMRRWNTAVCDCFLCRDERLQEQAKRTAASASASATTHTDTGQDGSTTVTATATTSSSNRKNHKKPAAGNHRPWNRKKNKRHASA